MGRCHLKSYRYTDDRNIDVVIKYVNDYNQKVSTFVDNFDTIVRHAITTQILALEEHRRNQKVNYYYFENIPYNYWQRMLDDKGKTRLVINSSPDGSLHELIKEPGHDRIGISNIKESIFALKEYLDSIAEDNDKTLRQFLNEREKMTTSFEAFTSAITGIVED